MPPLSTCPLSQSPHIPLYSSLSSWNLQGESHRHKFPLHGGLPCKKLHDGLLSCREVSQSRIKGVSSLRKPDGFLVLGHCFPNWKISNVAERKNDQTEKSGTILPINATAILKFILLYVSMSAQNTHKVPCHAVGTWNNRIAGVTVLRH